MKILKTKDVCEVLRPPAGERGDRQTLEPLANAIPSYLRTHEEPGEPCRIFQIKEKRHKYVEKRGGRGYSNRNNTLLKEV